MKNFLFAFTRLEGNFTLMPLDRPKLKMNELKMEIFLFEH